VADNAPTLPLEPPPEAPAAAVPETPAESTPLNEAPLNEYVKRRAQGENQSDKPAEDADPDAIDKGVPKPSDKTVPKTRFDQLYRQRSDAQRERDAAIAKAANLEAELTQLRQRAPAAEVVTPPEEAKAPVLDDYLASGKTYEDWMDARIEYQAQQIADSRIRAEIQRNVQITVEQQRTQEISGLPERTEAALARYPDYETVVIKNDRVQLSPVMTEIVARSPKGPDIMYWLGTHEAEANALGEQSRLYGPAAYPLMEQHLLLLSGQLQPSTGAKKAVPISQAPAPISPVGGGSTTTTASLDSMPLGDYVKRRNAIDQKKRTG